MKILIPGGTGDVGRVLCRYFVERGHDVVVLSRSGAQELSHGRALQWDGKSLGAWTDEMEGADVVINLAGRTVNCRYTDENLRQMMDSRVDSTQIIGEAIVAAQNPPAVWLQMSTATIYAHRFDEPNDEATGIIGGNEEGVPDYWGYSIEIAKRWEETQAKFNTNKTRQVAMRTAMVMSPEPGGIFGTLLGLVQKGVGGAVAGGEQYVSWIHEVDFARAVEFLIEREDLEGAINLASPDPRPQREHMALLRDAAGVSVGLPATKWMVEIGAFFMRTDTELILKSRRVVPGRLLEAGFSFEFPDWNEAAQDLVGQYRGGSAKKVDS